MCPSGVRCPTAGFCFSKLAHRVSGKKVDSERFLKKKHYDLYIKVHLIAFAMEVIRRVIAISHSVVSTAY
jgi:hypothetical protein